MFKRIGVYFILISFVITFIAASVCAVEYDEQYDDVEVSRIEGETNIFNLQAKCAILVDSASGSILFEKNSHERLSIASITKIMSMLLIMEAVDSGKTAFKDMIQVSDHAYSMGGSQVYLKPGEQFTVEEMLKAVAIHSANDATVALAEKVAGSEEAFVAMMNDKTKELEMKDTNFLDCSGLTDEGHYSSAYDIAIMSRELITKHPGILKYTSIWQDTFRDGEFALNNRNKLIRFYEGANGLKTGFTAKAGHCLAATAQRNDMQLIAVVLGEPDSNTRFAETRKLLDYGFANFEASLINTKGEVIQEVEVKKGLQTKVNVIYKNDVNLLLRKGDKDKIERIFNIDESLTAPVQQNQTVGEVIYKVDGKEVGKVESITESAVEKASFIKLFFRMILEWFGIGRD